MEQKAKSYVTDVFETGGAQQATLKKGSYIESVAEALPVLKEKDKFLLPSIQDLKIQILLLCTLPICEVGLLRAGTEFEKDRGGSLGSMSPSIAFSSAGFFRR